MTVSFSPTPTGNKTKTQDADELALRRAYLQRAAYLRKRGAFYDMLKNRLIRQPQTVTMQDVVSILLHLLNDMKASDSNEMRAWGHIIGDSERRNGLR